MLDIIEKHLADASYGCVVEVWIGHLPEEEQAAFARLKEHSGLVSISQVFQELDKEVKLPFKLTAFRSHLRGYCSCQK